MVQDKDELIRKRVLYIGSAVPIDTAEGLEGVQKPLRERYPVDDDNNIEGILSYISVVPSGITLQYVSDPSRILFFPITSLTLCAAVRCVTTINGASGERVARFMSLSSPQAGGANSKRPAIFTTITRRTEGRKVLECHGFICSSSKDALELVQYTSYADKLSKGKLNGTVMPPAAPASQMYHIEGHPSQRHFDTNTLKSTSAVSAAAAPVAGPDGEHPVRLVPGETSSQRVAPEFYEPPPVHGYFYKTKDSQIKTYAVERVLDGESERLRTVSPPTNTLPARAPPSERRSMYAGAPPATMTMTMPHPPSRVPTLIPVRAMPAPSATIVRPRFFSPPPPLLRPRPMPMPMPIPITPGHAMPRDPYVFLPPPPNIIDAPYIIRRRPQRRDSDSSSDSSRSSSPPSPRHMNGDGRRVVNGDGDASSDVSSRPRTPPTDYERGPRVSRREQFDRIRGYPLREVNGDYGTLPGPGPHPYDFYVYPPRYPYGPGAAGGFPPYMVERARSVPPPADRGKSKDRKKGRKGKKEKKKHNKSRVYGVPSDISTDSVGYTSEIGPSMDRKDPRMPRDFRRFENQYKHERAFSKSLAEEHRGGPEGSGNAYSLNEHMAQRAGVDHDFNLY